MKITSCLVTTCLVLGFTGITNAQTLPATKPTTQSAEMMWQTPLPEIRFDAVSLDNVIAFLHDLNPGFNATVMRDPGVPEGYPAITFRGRNFNIDQLLAFLRIAYGLQDSSFEGTDGSLFYVLKVRFDDKVQNYLDANPLARPAMVKVYSLRELITGMTSASANVPAPNKQAMNDILSLLQATLAEAGMGKTISIKAHEATQSLIINATPVQHELIENALGTLHRGPDELSNLSQQLETAQLRQALKGERDSNQALLRDYSAIRKQLDALQPSSTTRPKE